jgi:hypothetical protein
MTAVAVFHGRPDGIHIPDGRGVLAKVLRVRVDGMDKETSASRCGAAPEGYEVENPEQVARDAVETRVVNREHAPGGRINVRDEAIRDGCLCRSW